MANDCTYESPSAASPLSDHGENKENRQEAKVTGTRSSNIETY